LQVVGGCVCVAYSLGSMHVQACALLAHAIALLSRKMAEVGLTPAEVDLLQLYHVELDAELALVPCCPLPSVPSPSSIHSTPTPPPAETLGRTKRGHDRSCEQCNTRFTSQWRTGPTGPSTYDSPFQVFVMLTLLGDVCPLATQVVQRMRHSVQKGKPTSPHGNTATKGSHHHHHHHRRQRFLFSQSATFTLQHPLSPQPPLTAGLYKTFN
jgi:hypothetical protein